jgi:hypothetical protein
VTPSQSEMWESEKDDVLGLTLDIVDEQPVEETPQSEDKTGEEE